MEAERMRHIFGCGTAAVLLLSSCGVMMEKSDGEECRLKVSVEGISRTVRAQDITWNDIGTITLSTVSGDVEDEVRSWNRTEDETAYQVMQADGDIRFAAGTYEFMIELKNAGGTAVARGTVTEEIGPGDNILAFRVERTSEGYGSISVKVSWQAEDDVASVKAGLFTLSGEQEISGYGEEEIVLQEGAVSATYSKGQVPWGRYLLRFRFFDPYGVETRMYSDYVEVETEQESGAEIAVTDFLHFYSIVYEGMDGAVWAQGYSPVSRRNECISVQLPSGDDIRRTGYVFAGWYGTPDLSGEAVTECPPASADVVVYARWTPATDTAYKVEHYRQNVDGSTYPASASETESMTGTTEAPTAASAKSYTGFTAGTVTQETIAADGSTVVKIYYTRNIYEVAYDPNGGDGTMASTSICYGADGTLRANAFARAGYSFSGWNTKADGSGTPYADSASFGQQAAENTTLYAQWTANDASITVELPSTESVDISLASSTEGTKVTFTAGPIDGAEYTWLLDTAAIGNGTQSITIDTSTLECGIHEVMVAVKKGSHYYTAKAVLKVAR